MRCLYAELQGLKNTAFDTLEQIQTCEARDTAGCLVARQRSRRLGMVREASDDSSV